MIDAGYVIYDADDTVNKFEFNKTVGGRGVSSISTSHEKNRLELKTFGKVPYIYYAGDTDYEKFNLTGVFHYNEEAKETARQQVDRFYGIVKARKPLVVANSQGREFICDVSITGESAPLLYVDKDMDYIEVSVECTEIDF